MIKPNNVMGGILIFVTLISLYVSLYVNFEDVYGVTRDATSCPRINRTVSSDCIGETQSIVEALQSTITLSGINDVMNAIQKFSVPGNILQKSFEVLTGAGLGIIKIFLGLVALPYDLAKIVLNYYNLPAVAVNSIAILLNIYILFIMVRYILKQE